MALFPPAERQPHQPHFQKPGSRLFQIRQFHRYGESPRHSEDGAAAKLGQWQDDLLRLLDGAKVEEERSFWQFINILLPLLLVIAGGYVYQALRKRKYQE